MTSYTAQIELETSDTSGDALDELMSAFAPWHPAIGLSETGWIEIAITLPADDIRQAGATATALVASATDIPVRSFTISTSEDFDARATSTAIPDLVSVTEAAAVLGLSRQRVLQMLASHALRGRQVGSTWVIPRGALDSRSLAVATLAVS